jgi:hypothetical protein
MTDDKITLLCDTECYPDYFLAMFRDIASGKTMHFELYEGHALDRKTIHRILKRYRIVTFNGTSYDAPMLTAALHGADNARLKLISDTIIVQGLKSWQFEQKFDMPVFQFDHIDLIEVAPGVATSLKLYGGRMHAQRLQDLPIEPNHLVCGPEPIVVRGEVISTPEGKREALRVYCGNDLTTTGNLFSSLKQQIDLRVSMSAEYGQDLRSKSDAQIAEAVIRAQVKKITWQRVDKPVIPPGTTFRYQPPAFLTYGSAVMRDTLEMVRSAKFVVAENGSVEMPDELAKARICIGGSVYRMGIGGLHSSESAIAHRSDANNVLIDRDVASFYPRIILVCNLAPRHLGDPFLRVYRDIVDRRLEAKRAGNKVVAESLKITINGTFGKLGSKFSALYSPDLMIQVTLTGQLSLLMLIERIEAATIPVVSANTDGLVIRAPRSLLPALEAIIAQWERETGFDTEETRYRALYSRDVNNYLAVKEDGGVKTKGIFASPGLMKNPTTTICADAVAATVRYGTSIEQTILGCRDIRKFVTVRTVKGGAMWRDDYLGKVVRWYYSSASDDPILYRSNGNKVPLSDGAMTLMVLPFNFPDDLDHQVYVHRAYEMLTLIGAYK